MASSITTSSFWDNKILKHNYQNYVNLPTGMVEHTDEHVKLLVDNNNDHFNIFVINVLYRLNPTYLEGMDEWDPSSGISMFNDWDGSGERMPLLDAHELSEMFEKLMVRYAYVEHMLHQLTTKEQEESNTQVVFSTKKNILSTKVTDYILLLICIIYMMVVTLMWNTYILSLLENMQTKNN